MKHARFPVIHVADLPWERQAKIALGMRRLGLPSLLIYVRQPVNFDPADYFDHVIKCESPQEAFAIAQRARPSIVHLSSFGADNTCVQFMHNRFCKLVYDYKDVFENVIGWPMPPHHYDVQRLCIENADGLVCRDLQLWNYCRVNKVRTRGKRIYFPDYTWNTAPPRPARPIGEREIHIGYIGNFTVEKMYPHFADSGYLEVARALASHEIHLHMYPHWHFEFVVDPPNQMIDYYELANSSRYFHLHGAVPLDRVHAEITNYDFGIAVQQAGLFDIPMRTNLCGHERYGIATRIFDYVEAGLPVISTATQRLQSRILERGGAGFGLKPDDVAGLRERILRAMADGIYHRVESARQRWAIDKQLPRLLAFYAAI